jgi:hypothetical protein
MFLFSTAMDQLLSIVLGQTAPRTHMHKGVPAMDMKPEDVCGVPVGQTTEQTLLFEILRGINEIKYILETEDKKEPQEAVTPETQSTMLEDTESSFTLPWLVG